MICALLAASPAAQTIDHLTIVAPAAPGGGWDQTARALQHVIDAHRLTRVVEVQNVPGAAGTIGLRSSPTRSAATGGHCSSPGW